MQIGIAGAGKVGTTLGKYVKDHGACGLLQQNRSQRAGICGIYRHRIF